MRRYQIVTIFTDPAQHAAMADTYRRAGFDDARARFTPLDNSAGNRFDPYAVLDGISTGATAGDEPYVIVCHQDVRLDQGDGVAELDAIVAAVSAADPDWAVLGNAGVNYRRQRRGWLTDPVGADRTAPVPESCLSLDENWVLVQRRCAPRTTSGLAGFHLYGTDVVLNAAVAGRRSYVVPFLLTHLSRGNPASADFAAAREQFDRAWNGRLLVGIVNTTCTYFVLSRRPAVRWFLRRWRVRDALARWGLTLAPTWAACLGLSAGSSFRLRRTLGR